MADALFIFICNVIESRQYSQSTKINFIQVNLIKNMEKEFFSKTFFLKQIKSIVIVLSFFFCFTVTYAQSFFSVSGTVTDEKGETIIGATVKEKGGSMGTITDIEGKFTLSVSGADAILVFSYLGMNTKEVPVNNKKTLNVTMQENATALNEVVVTALGIKREAKALGYAVAEVSSEDLTAGRENNIMSALSGKVAGVDISSTSAGPSGSTRVVIRGNSQIAGNNMPLYVIDGVPMDNTQQGSAGKFGGYDYGDGLSSVSADDIESISVLKGASASALYGSRASNGVVLITTKSGQKNKKLGVTVSSDVTFVKLLSQFDDYQRVYGQGRNGKPSMNEVEAQSTSMLAWGPKLDPDMQTTIYDGSLKSFGNKENNILSFFRTGTIYNNAISFDGGSDKTTFRASISDMRNRDIVPTSDMKRTTFMVRGTTKLGENLTIDSRVNYTVEKVNNRPALSDKSSNIGNALIGLAPNFDQKWLAEKYKGDDGMYTPWNEHGVNRLNPYWVINEMTNRTDRDRVMGYIKLDYRILPFLNLQLRGGTDFYNFEITEFTGRYTPGKEGGEMIQSDRHVREDNYEALLRFNKKFMDKLDVSAFVGGNIRRSKNKIITNTGSNQIMDDLRSITNYKTNQLVYELYKKQVNSVYGAVNLGYDDTFYLDFTLRNDISSTLSNENRSYTYPSVSGSFIFSKFFNLEKSFLSFGKVRASWAKVGGDTDPYQLNLIYGLLDLSFQGERLGEIKSKIIPNKNLKPTSTYSYEFGTDLRFLNERISLDLTYYHQTTKDQILGLPVSKATGYDKAMINAGEIVNKGFEVALNGTPVTTRDFDWDIGISFAKNKNEVKELHSQVQDYELSSARWGNAFIYASEGQPYGNIVGKAFKRDPQGNIIYSGGMPVYDDKVQILGNGVYDFTLGINQSFRYKNFNLRMLFDMKFGADIFSMTALQSYKYGTSRETLSGREEWYQSERAREAAGEESSKWVATGGYLGKGVKNVGTAENPEYVPNDIYVNPEDYWKSVADNAAEPFIYDVSFIKLRELNITYNIPQKLLAKTPFQSVSLSAYGRNLWIIYDKVKNIDPESDYTASNGKGFEYGSLPSRRNFGFGINVKF